MSDAFHYHQENVDHRRRLMLEHAHNEDMRELLRVTEKAAAAMIYNVTDETRHKTKLLLIDGRPAKAIKNLDTPERNGAHPAV